MIRIESLRERRTGLNAFVESGLRMLRRAGWAGLLGLVLLLAAAVIQVTTGEWAAARRADLAAQRAQLAGQSPAGARGAPSAASFLAAFPAGSELPRVLARLYELSDAHGLNVERTAYRRADEPGTPLTRVSLQMPVQGRYGALYAWLGEVLGTMPAVGLESFSIRRVDQGADLVEADIRLVVFARQGE